MKLGLNSVLFGAWDMETAFKYTAMAGYDGIEVSAIGGMSQHLVLDNWRETAREAKRLGAKYSLDLLAMEQSKQDPRHDGAGVSGRKRSGHSHCQLRGRAGNRMTKKPSSKASIHWATSPTWRKNTA